MRSQSSHRKLRAAAVVCAAVAVAGGVGGAVWALTRGDSSGHTGADPSRPAVTVTATQSVPSPD
ncbi:hypothetical protein ACFTZM_10765, partial [Streptomyces hydrogenans]